MILNLIGIINNDGARLDFDGELNFGEVEFLGVYRFEQPALIQGEVLNISGALLLRANVKGVAVTNCARCYKPLEIAVDYSFEQTLLTSESTAEDEDAYIITSGNLDVDEIALENFYNQLRPKYLCSDNCKGLCPVCGADKNLAECDCEDIGIDPRLSQLNELFKD